MRFKIKFFSRNKFVAAYFFKAYILNTMFGNSITSRLAVVRKITFRGIDEIGRRPA